MFTFANMICKVSSSLSILIACISTPQTSEIEDYIEGFAQEVGVSFEEIRKIYPSSYEDLGWTRPYGGVIGRCTYATPGKPGKVEFDQENWSRSWVSEKEAIIWHEMGHCVCGLNHPVEIKELESNFIEKVLAKIGIRMSRNDKYFLPDGCPKSFMHPIVPSANCIDEHRAEYKQEIIDNCKLPFINYYDVGEILRKIK